MKYILDTNALIYSLCNPAGLTKIASQIITTEKELYVSITSFWEIAIKQSLGKLAINSTIPDIEKICKQRSIEIVPILSDEMEGVKSLPQIHKDPFDRLIISQAIKHNMSIITSDTIIPQYAVNVVW